MKLIEIYGWISVLLILTAFALVSFSVILPTSTTYYALNAVGAFGIIIDTVKKKDIQPAVLNIAWFLIALAGLLGFTN